MSDWLRERLERYHAEMAAKGHDRRLVVGPILVTVLRERANCAIRLMIGDCEVVVAATPKGRRVFVSIDDGHADVQTGRRHKGGRWS